MIWKVNLIKFFYEEITGLTFTKDSRYLIAACVGGNKIAVRDICALAKDARTYKNQYNTSIVYTSKDINKLMNIFLIDWIGCLLYSDTRKMIINSKKTEIKLIQF